MLVFSALSFVAGLLTVLAPCVLPFLPIIVGGSLQGQRWRPYVVCASLVVSLLLFSLLLKASTLLLDISPQFWSYLSAAIVFALGLSMLFPDAWTKISDSLGLNRRSHELLEGARKKEGLSQAILSGAALGPVFSSCSPTYAWVIASILPADPIEGLIYLGLYSFGLALALLAISLIGRKLISRLGWAANPHGLFQKIIAILFIVVALLIATGFDKKIQTELAGYSDSLASLEEKLVPHEESPHQQASLEEPLSLAYKAPELQGIRGWINSEPLSLEKLKGKVVLIDFWTYSCINCQRTQPYLNAWYERYKAQGFTIIGVHAPEFSFEKKYENVAKAVQDAKIDYPVALDNDFKTWTAYENRYWPAKYLIDQEGNVRYVHFGEGNYEETEKAIQLLLEIDEKSSQVQDLKDQAKGEQSPETYFGIKRAANYQGSPLFSAGEHEFSPWEHLKRDEWTLGGVWDIKDERILAKKNSSLDFMFSGSSMHLVMSSQEPRKVAIEFEGKREEITILDDKLYTVVDLDKAKTENLVHLEVEEGVSLYAATFGS